MNLIDFTVTKVLSEPVQHIYPDVSYWSILVEYYDDGMKHRQKTISMSTLEEILKVEPGYVGQH